MRSMPYALKHKLRQYDNAITKANSLHIEIIKMLEKYEVPYDNLVANVNYMSNDPFTEALAFINNNEGNIEENISYIEEVFLHFVNKNSNIN